MATNRKHYHVVCNTPGYLPESDPAVFTTRRMAEQYAIDCKNQILEDNYMVDGVHNVAAGSARAGQIYIVDTNREHDLGTYITITPCTDPGCEEYLD